MFSIFKLKEFFDVLRKGIIMDDREFKEWVDNVARKKASVLSLLAGLPDFIMSGAAERNALEYEAAYTKLLDQVKDKSHDEKVI